MSNQNEVLIKANDKIELEYAEISPRKDGIVEVLIKESSAIGRKECEEIVNSYSKILDNKKYPLLHIVEEYVTIDKDAREYASSEEGLKYSKVEAFVINSLAHKILANFYMKVNKPAVPTRFFSDKKEAEQWLLKYL